MPVLKSQKKAEKLLKVALKARKRAHAPYSNFLVGAALESEGKIFYGCNVENVSNGATVCAERIAMYKAVSEGHKKIDFLVVALGIDDKVGPCGLCLQTLAEFARPELEVWVGSPRGLQHRFLFKELFPMAYYPEHLKT